MGQPVSDAVFELAGACVHSVRFAIGAPLDYPYAPGRPAPENPPAAFYRRVLAVSPPPARAGEGWETGLTLDGRPFDPAAEPERLGDVRRPEGLSSLDVPEPGKIVLDQWFTIPRQPRRMAFPGPDQGRYLLSVPYWTPVTEPGETLTKQVDYFATHRLEWAKRPAGRWVALSFDAFWPPERDSADVIIPLGDCDAECPTS